MSGIYQEIWNADQEENGIEALLDTEQGSEEHGYVQVNSQLATNNDENLKVLTRVHIPQNKMTTYTACLRLFNNYSLAEPMPENDTAQERQEVHDFVNSIINTRPMEVAREYIARETGSTVSKERWYNTVVEMWFRRFSAGGDPALSGFEHVVVGEQQGPKVQGYHFWWKYYLDDGLGNLVDDAVAVPIGLSNDRITYHGSKMKGAQRQYPESVTISYRWNAPDYDAMAIRPLYKKIGGFFVGCSVEGLMALGTVRAHKGVRAPHIAVIEGARYDMKLYHSPNGQHIRTFYPVFLGSADIHDGTGRNGGDTTLVPAIPNQPDRQPGGGSSDIRIIGAKVNPIGDDVGFETVTIVNTSSKDQNLTNWQIRDKNGSSYSFDEKTLSSGEFATIRLSGEDVQLSNRGGVIELLNPAQQLVHRVTYSKTQAKSQGNTVLF